MLRFGPETNELTRAAPIDGSFTRTQATIFSVPLERVISVTPVRVAIPPPMVHVVPCGCLPLSIVRQTPLLAREISEPLSQDLAGESDEPIISAGLKNPSISSV